MIRRDCTLRLPALFGIVVAMITSLVLCGCSGARTMRVAESPAPIVGTDSPLNEPKAWGSPKVLRQATGGFVVRLSPVTSSGSSADSAPITVSLGGIGWPRVGVGFGHSYIGPGILSTWTGEGATYSVSFTTNARRVSLVVWNMGGLFQIRVGSTALGSPRLVGTGYHHHGLDVDFATSARRTITFDLAGPVYFTGLRVGGGNTRVSVPALPHPVPPSIYWLGDSYVAGGGATHPGFDDLAHLASSQAKLTDVTIDALGGTGYLRTNEAAHFPPYLARARLNLGGRRARPRLIVVGGSINDDVYGQADVERAAAALYRYLDRAVPGAHVIVVPFASGYPVPQAQAAANRGILAAARGAPNVVGVLDLPARVLALAGAAGAERRSGALESRVVKYHPSEAGHRLYGRIIGAFLANCLRTLNARGASRGVCDQAS